MPRNKPPSSELGAIYVRGAEFWAHIQFRDDGGNNTNIYGPSRGSQNEAQKDLDQIRMAGGVGATREEGIKLSQPAASQPSLQELRPIEKNATKYVKAVD